MSEAEEKFMEDKGRMQSAITTFHESCSPIGIDDEGFMDDINDAVSVATDGRCKFEDWFE